MTRRLAESLARLLEPDERQAVLGDIAESGESAIEALRDVLGLVARRQAALWKGTRPWLALFGLVIPLAVALGRASMRTAHTSAIYFWMYFNNWDWDLLRNPAFRFNTRQVGQHFALSYLQLIVLSWAGGRVLAWAGRRAAPVHALLFSLAVLATPFPQPLSRGPAVESNAPVFALVFYQTVFPWILQTALVLLPALWAMRQAARKENLA
jgi:hypothetical protein